MVLKVKEYFKKEAEYFSDALDKSVPQVNNPQAVIYEAMRYSLLAGGKRLRPVLMSECCRMCGGKKEDVLPFAVAMEMIHTYSLIHDDLPAMDNDDLRRGLPTNHIKFGEATAILAGDGLLNKAFEVMSSSTIDAGTVVRAINIVAKSSGTEGMIGGQVVDIAAENRKITLDELRYVHANKTGAIIKASCVCGAVVAGADEEKISAVSEFAENLGIAFQIKDDILDVVGDAEKLGKPTGSDVQSGKNTYVSICGYEKSNELLREYSEKAKAALFVFGEKAKFLLWLTDYLTKREN